MVSRTALAQAAPRGLLTGMCALALSAFVAAGCGENAGEGASGGGGEGGIAGDSGTGGMGGDAGSGGVGGGTSCAETDCDDANPCTEDLCDLADGTCSNPAFTDGTICFADENPGRCVAGECTGLCEFVDCDDGNDCTDDRCDPAHGSCFNPPLSDGTTCDAGGDPGQCSAGLCLGLCADADCDDGKECTEDLCDKADGSCEHPNRPEGSDCDFGGLPGRCEAGTCVDAELCREADCNDGNDCTEDVCDPANANCSNPNKVDGAFCQTGGNPGLCRAGVCQGLCEGVSCDDGNQCTVDMCDPSNASCPNPDKTDGTPCDYGDDPGRCSAGLCVGLCTGIVCNDQNQCTSDACDPLTGSCTHTDREDGTSCDFGGIAGQCVAGVCGPSVFPCTEQGIRDAIATGGGPHTFACDGPTTITIGSTIGINNDVTLDGEGDLTVESPPAYWDFQNSPDDPFLSYPVFSVPVGVTAELIGITASGGRPYGVSNAGTLGITRSSIVGNGGGFYIDGAPFPGGGEGGIKNTGDLTVTDSSVSNNYGNLEPGGISNLGGTVTIIRSEIAGNIHHAISSSGALTILDSTISFNSSGGSRYGGFGGVTVSSSGRLLIANTTFSGNSSHSDEGSDGVIRGSGSGVLINSTVSGNSVLTHYGSGSNQLDWSGPELLEVIGSTVVGTQEVLIGSGVRVTNSIIAYVGPNDTYRGACVLYSSPTIPSSGGGNIESPGDTCGFDQTTDLFDVTAAELNLGPLQDNGGPTETHALGEDSVAIDHIPAVDCVDADGQPLTTDQRGVLRPQGPACDVGAFELEAGP